MRMHADGDYEAPETVLPQARATSPGGAYRLEASQNGSIATLTIRNASTNSIVQTFNPPIARLQLGWSPDGDRFLYVDGSPRPEGPRVVDVRLVHLHMVT